MSLSEAPAATAQPIVLIDDGARRALTGEVAGDKILVDRDALLAATGWELKSAGLCKGPACAPVRNQALLNDARLDLAAFADALGAPLAIDPAHKAAAIGARVEDRLYEQDTMIAPDFALPDLRGEIHRLRDYTGKKILLVAWSSWCGCREDMPVWQSLYEEMKDGGLMVITIAQDSNLDDARPFIEKAAPTHPALIDVDHVISARFGLINVPSVVWIDEDGVICRPPRVEHGSNIFQFAHGLDCEPHLSALRRWVATGEADLSPDEARNNQMPPTFEEELARAEFALGNYLYAEGLKGAAEAAWERAIELSPDDWTIRRGTMWRRGQNPFGEDFGVVWREWEEKGKPDYQSLARARRARS